jgi:glycosyltransferase involved in cell wall biosynthesis
MKIDTFASNRPIKKLSILIAAYNEVATIITAIESLKSILASLTCDSEIIVIESNSTDGTRELLQEKCPGLGFTLLLENSPKGKGSAVRLGMSKMSGDVFLIYDADVEYLASDIPKLLIPIENGEASFVLGTRHEKGRAMRVMEKHKIRPGLMNFAHRLFTFLINTSFNVRLTDPFTMYKVFRSEVFEGVEFVCNRFDFDWELVCKAIRLGSRPVEIPISYKSRSFSQGKKVKFFMDPITWIIALVRFRITPIKRLNVNN